jgi:hypothetical protein
VLASRGCILTAASSTVIGVEPYDDVYPTGRERVKASGPPDVLASWATAGWMLEFRVTS